MHITNEFAATEYIFITINLKFFITSPTYNFTKVDLKKGKSQAMNNCIAKPVNDTPLYGKIIGNPNKAEVKI